MRMNVVPEELRFDPGWGLGESKFELLLKDLQSFHVENLVEFGSGVSSARLALSLPQLKLLSIESNPAYCEQTVQLLDRFVPGHNVTVETRRLCWQWHGLRLYQSYEPGPFPYGIDAVLIDGPPYWTFRGREACLYQVFRSLRVGGRVYLDDYERPDEQQAARNWQAVFPGVFEVRVLETSPTQLCVLEKVSDFPRLHISVQSTFDNWVYHAKRRAVELRDHICHRNS